MRYLLVGGWIVSTVFSKLPARLDRVILRGAPRLQPLTRVMSNSGFIIGDGIGMRTLNPTIIRFLLSYVDVVCPGNLAILKNKLPKCRIMPLL